MTTLFTSHEFEMDVSHLDDKMELGTSPYPHLEDIDFDLEPIRQQSIDRSMEDDTEAFVNSTDPMQADAEHDYNDDDMLDDNNLDQLYGDDTENLNMETFDDDSMQHQDEEILYDEEDSGSLRMTGQEEQQHADQSEEFSYNNYDQESDIVQPVQENTVASNDNTTDSRTGESQGISHNIEESTNLDEAEETLVYSHDEVSGQTDVVDFATEQEITQPSVDNIDAKTQAPISTSEGDSSEEVSHERQAETDKSISAEPTIGAVPISESDTEDLNIPIQANEAVSNNLAEPLYPVTVVYLGQEMSLFPPMANDSSATFFVSEHSLAYEPVDKLLASCREILGESLGHDDELVLDVQSLGLHICEDSKYASQITLSQIIDVYSTLSRNESIENIEPLYCHLSSRVGLASQYAYLAGSAAEGKTYSEIAADYVESSEHEEESYQETDEDHQNHGDQDSLDTAHIKDEYITNTENTQIQPSRSEAGDGQDSATAFHESIPSNDENGRNGNINVEPADIGQSNAPQKSPKEDEEVTESPNVRQEPLETSQAADSQAVESRSLADEHDSADAGDSFENDVEDEPEEASSISSHTVEAEATVRSAEQLQQSSDATQNFDNQVATDNDQQAPDEMDNYENYNMNEDLFRGDEVEEQLDDHSDVEDVFTKAEEQVAVNGNTLGDAKLDEDEDVDYEELALDEETHDADGSDQNENVVEIDLEVEEIAAGVPVTPSKTNGSKRKALPEQDELDFLDISTPEPKRTRAS